MFLLMSVSPHSCSEVCCVPRPVRVYVCISLRDVSGCVGRCLIAQMGLLLLVFGLSGSDAVEQKHSPRVQNHYPHLNLYLRLSLMLNCRQKPWPGVNTHAPIHWAVVFIRFMSVFLISCSFSSVSNITIILSFILVIFHILLYIYIYIIYIYIYIYKLFIKIIIYKEKKLYKIFHVGMTFKIDFIF